MERSLHVTDPTDIILHAEELCNLMLLRRTLQELEENWKKLDESVDSNVGFPADSGVIQYGELFVQKHMLFSLASSTILTFRRKQPPMGERKVDHGEMKSDRSHYLPVKRVSELGSAAQSKYLNEVN
ncbi:hypothetical protein CBL_00244 [Carabus blaptoides fortunei]